MIVPRRSKDRGHANHGWLDTFHSFSFGEYHDARFMGFRSLRVINEDVIAPGMGFGTHGHRDMEILTYLLDGALEHKDSMGTGSIIRPGEIQRMSAGTGVTHSEFNHSKTDQTHLLQIWLLPFEKGLTPGYEQKKLLVREKKNAWVLAASGQPSGQAVRINQDAQLLIAKLEPKEALEYSIKSGRYVWVQVARGAVTLNGFSLSAGDGAAISQEKELIFHADLASEVLLFDLS